MLTESERERIRDILVGIVIDTANDFNIDYDQAISDIESIFTKEEGQKP